MMLVDKTNEDIIKTVGDDVVHITNLEASDKTKGIIQIAPDTTQPFVITSLKSGTQYSFFLRIIHPDTTPLGLKDRITSYLVSKGLMKKPAGKPYAVKILFSTSKGVCHLITPYEKKANEHTEYKRDTDVVQGRSKTEKYWHVSTFARSFKGPKGIAVASDGTVYVADTGNHRIKKITPNGEVDIIAGSTKGYKNISTGTFARFNTPYGIAVAPDGKALYVTDRGNNSIRKITLPWYAVTTTNRSRYTTPDFASLRGIAHCSKRQRALCRR